MKFITSKMKKTPSDSALNYIFKVLSSSLFLYSEIVTCWTLLIDMIQTLSWLINFFSSLLFNCCSFSCLWVEDRVYISDVIHLLFFVDSAVRINQGFFVEGLSLIISISVFSTDDVCMGITLSSPRGLIKQLRVSLESTCNGAASCRFVKIVIKFDLLHGKLTVGIWFSSGVWLEISLSERSGPLLIKAWMRCEHCGFTVSSEEVWSCFVKSSLISLESILVKIQNKWWNGKKNLLGASEAIGCILECLLFVDASSRDLGVASSELGIALLTWDETSVFRDGVVSKRNWVL